MLTTCFKSFTNSKCLVDNATLIQLFKSEHSYLNFSKHSTNKQIDPCGRGSLTRSARRRRRGMNDAYLYTVLTLSLPFLTHYTMATYIRPIMYYVCIYMNDYAVCISPYPNLLAWLILRQELRMPSFHPISTMSTFFSIEDVATSRLGTSSCFVSIEKACEEDSVKSYRCLFLPRTYSGFFFRHVLNKSLNFLRIRHLKCERY